MSFGQLIISQYIETNSGTAPKGIELYNNTGATINFAATPLTVFQGTNGGALSQLTAANVSTGTLASQAVLVIGTADIGTYLVNNGLSSVTFVSFNFGFNGDDALEIRLNGVIQDTFGTPGSDPITSWPSPSGGSPSTANQNIEVTCAFVNSFAFGAAFTDPAVRFSFVANATPGSGLGAAGLAGFGVAPNCPPPACTATLSSSSATCDAVTAGTDTYTSTFTFDIGSESGSFSVSTDSGTPDVATISASGTITVTGVNEGTDVMITVTLAPDCNLNATATSPSCDPLPTSVQFVLVTSTAVEGGTSVDVCAAITNPSSLIATDAALDLFFISDAINGNDFDNGAAGTPISFPYTLTFPAASSANQCMTVFFSTDDALVEADEFAIFDIISVTGGFSPSIGINAQHQMTITDNDGPQPCPTAPVWEVVTTDNNPAATDGNNGEWTAVGPTGYTANGFCSGCTDLVDTWLVYGPLDASSATALSMTLDATESFGITDLNFQYSTDYGSVLCPSSATWTSAGTIIGSGTGLSFDMTSVAGSSGIFIGIQYNDDGVNGYSDWTLDNFVLVSDVCPSVGSPVTSSCVVCTTTLSATGATCDSNVGGSNDPYTATFDYDATTEINDLAVTVTGGTSATMTVTAGTSGTITVSGIEGTDVTVALTNSLCTLSATQNSPVCVPIPTSSCGLGETSLVFDPFEVNSVANIIAPATYDVSNDTWAIQSSIGGIAAAQDGIEFWGMEDLDNTNGGGAFDHELTYNISLVAGTYSSLNVSFWYYTIAYNLTDHLGYKYSVDGGTQVVNDQSSLDALSQGSGGWTNVTLSIPLTGSSTSAQFILYGFQNGGGQVGGFDNLNICGSSAVACTASLLQDAVSCDANTAGVDTYTASFSYDASLESEDLTISVVPAPSSQSATTITAGTAGTFTVTALESVSSFTVTVSNSACSFEETVTGVTCDPLAQLVISEIMYNTSGTDDEWIEICNSGLTDQALVGFEILYNAGLKYTFPIGTPDILVGECLTIALGDNGTAPFNPACGFTPDYTNGSGSNTLGNTLGTLTLTDGANTIDEVSYSDSNGAAGNDASLHVIDINADNSTTGSNWQEVAAGGSPGVNSLFSICAANEDCADAVEITPSVFGIGSWESYALGASESLPGCTGDADDDVWFRFTALSSNDVVLAKDPASGYDVVIELFSACAGTSLACSNVYGAGAIERYANTALTPGTEYYFRVYDAATGASASTDVQVMVKTFEDCQLYGSSCGITAASLAQTIYAERDNQGQLYANPVVGVIGYGFRFQEQGGPLDVTIQQPVEDGFYFQLVNAGLEYGKTYDVSVQHLVGVPANGSLFAYWSGFGTVCTVTLGAAPTATLKPQYCSGVTDYYLADQIQSVYMYGASQYRFSFAPSLGGPSLVKTSNNYSLGLYTVGSVGSGLQYGQSYVVSVEALIAGIWTAPGAPCTIFMQTQPEDTRVRPPYCGGTYLYPQSNFILANTVVGASQYEFKFTPSLGGTPMSEVKSGISFAFHTTGLPFIAGTTYNVEVRALAGGQTGDYSISCPITLVSPPLVNNGEELVTAKKSLDKETNSYTLYPNPNDGSEFMISIESANDMAGNMNIEVMDITGKVVYTALVPVKGNTQFKVSPRTALHSGLYLVRLTQAGESQVLKVNVR